MYQRVTSFLLRLLRVPHEPQPPHGDPASLRVFRAGGNFFKLKLLGWGLAQLLAFAGIVFWVGVFIDVESEVHARRQSEPGPPALSIDSIAKSVGAAGRETAQTVKGKEWRKYKRWAGFKQSLVQVALTLPDWAFPLIWVLKIIGILAYFAQLPVTYLITRLDYELRWYMVTDRSLRIRHGVLKVTESTMSFANIQQVVVSQGPIQRLLGLADVKVQSAGGGSGGGPEHHQQGEDMHVGLFHCVTNAPEIRDLILDRLRRFRESGLGDPDEKSPPLAITPASTPASGDLLTAAQELAAEARALRVTLG